MKNLNCLFNHKKKTWTIGKSKFLFSINLLRWKAALMTETKDVIQLLMLKHMPMVVSFPRGAKPSLVELFMTYVSQHCDYDAVVRDALNSWTCHALSLNLFIIVIVWCFVLVQNSNLACYLI